MTSDHEGMRTLAFAAMAIVAVLLGGSASRAWPEQEWTVWAGLGISAGLALLALVGSIRLVRQRPTDRGLPIAALVLSAAILAFEIGLALIVLVLTYALRDLTF